MIKYTLFSLTALFFYLTSYSQTCIECSIPIPINNGLIFCAPMNGSANDVTASPLTPTVSGAAALTNDRLGNVNNAYDLSNISTAKILYSSSSKLSVPNYQSLTMSIWFYARSTHSFGSYLMTMKSSNNSAFSLLIGGGAHGANNGKLIFNDFYGPTSTSPLILPSPSIVSLNTWHHVAITIDKSTNSNSLYLDGILVASAVLTNSDITNGDLTIGNNYVNSWGIDGKIDDARIYDRALSASEISELYNTFPIPDQTICLNDSVQLTAAGGTAYSWSPTTGLSNPNIANPYAKPTTSTQYIVTITNGTCTTTDTVMVNVNTNCCFTCTDPAATTINNGLVGCYPFNGNANDESGNANNGTALASATLTTDRKNLASKAYDFDGTANARVNVPASASLNTATMASFTYACWFNTGSATPTIRRLFCIQDATFKNYDLSYDYSNNKLNFINYNGVSNNINFYSKATFALNTWYHVAVVVNASNKAQLYVNGVLDTFSNINVIKPSNPTYTIGNHAVNPWNFVGKIDDVRIYNRALTSPELVQLALQVTPPVLTPISDKTICLNDSVQLTASGGTAYSWSPTTGLSNPYIANPYAKPASSTQYIVTITNGICSITDTVMVNVNTNCCATCSSPDAINAGLVGCYPFDANVNDASGNNINGIASNITYTPDRFGNANKAISLNGTSSYVDITNTAFQLSQYTYSLWVNAPSPGAAVRSALSIGTDVSDQALLYFSSGYAATSYNTDATSISGVQTASAPAPNVWHHIVMSRSNTTLSLYMNGNLIASASVGGKSPGYGGAGYAAQIGRRVGSVPQYFLGKIDDVRIYNRVLSASEVSQLYTLVGIPVVTPIADKTICQGDSVQLTATGGTSYSWSPTTGLSNPNIASPYAKPTGNQQYIVTISNGICTNTDTVMVTVNTNCCVSCTTTDPLNNGLLACFPFNGNASDQSGGGNNPTSNTATLTTDRFGKPNSAYHFNGFSGQYIRCTNANMPTGNSARTISIWVKYDGIVNASQTLTALGFGAQTTSNCQGVGLYNNNIRYLGWLNELDVPYTYNTTSWMHIVTTYTGTVASIYVNGTLIGSAPKTWNTIASADLLIGTRTDALNSFFNGSIDDIRIYSRALSQSEITALYIHKGPVIVTPIADKTICQGDSVQLIATGGTSYSWSPTTGLSNPNIASPYAKPTTNQQYIVTISNGTCIDYDTVMVTVNNNCCGSCIPTIPINSGLLACYPFTGNMNDETMRNGSGTNSGATLTADRFSGANRAYTFNGSNSISIPTSALSNNTYSYSAWVKLASLPTNGNAYCILGIGGNVAGDQALMVTNNYSGGQTGFTATSYRTPVNPSGPDKYSTGGLPSINTWYHLVMVRDVTNNSLKLYVNGVKLGDIPLTSATAAYDLPAQGSIGVRAPGNIQYFDGSIDDVRVYNRVLTDNDVLILYNIPNQTPFAPDAGTDRNICVGDSVQLTATGGNSYTWLPSTSLSQTSIANPYAKPADSTKYFVTVSTNICSAMDSVNVNVNKITVNAGTDLVMCFQDSIQLQATASIGAAFSWTPSASLSNAGIYNPYAKPADTTTYTVTATLNGCSAKDSMIVNVKEVLADAGTGGTICAGDSLQLLASGGTSYAWTRHNTLSDTSIANPYAKPTTTTKYYVKVIHGLCSNTDSVTVNINSFVINAGVDTSVCLGDSVRLLATGAISYAWWTSTTLSDTSVANPYAKPSDTTMYYVNGKSGACTAVDSVKVNVKKTVVDAGLPQTICKYDSIQLNATGSPGATFSWAPAGSVNNPAIANPYAKPLDTTMYTVTATSNGCAVTDSVKVNIRKANADAGTGGSVCAGDSLHLSASGGTSYTWQNDPTLSSLTVSDPYAKPLITTMYYVTVNDGTCYEMDSVEVTIRPTPTVDLGPDTTICANDMLLFMPVVSNGDVYSWQPTTMVDDATIINPTTILGSGSQLYTLTATNSVSGCSANDEILVTAQKPTAQFSLEDTANAMVPFEVTPNNTSYPLPLLYEWEMLDTVPVYYTTAEPTHTFMSPGTFRISLAVTDMKGCMDTMSTTITVSNEVVVFIPTVFTPNGDGLNDLFIIQYPPGSILGLKGSIWNRWGSKVYEFGSPDYKWWDGKIDNKDAGSEVYFFIIELVGLNGEVKKQNGTITLLR